MTKEPGNQLRHRFEPFEGGGQLRLQGRLSVADSLATRALTLPQTCSFVGDPYGDDLARAVLDLASGDLTEQAFTRWLPDHSGPV